MTTYLGKKNDHMATQIIRNKTKKTYGLYGTSINGVQSFNLDVPDL